MFHLQAPPKKIKNSSHQSLWGIYTVRYGYVLQPA